MPHTEGLHTFDVRAGCADPDDLVSVLDSLRQLGSQEQSEADVGCGEVRDAPSSLVVDLPHHTMILPRLIRAAEPDRPAR